MHRWPLVFLTNAKTSSPNPAQDSDGRICSDRSSGDGLPCHVCWGYYQVRIKRASLMAAVTIVNILLTQQDKLIRKDKILLLVSTWSINIFQHTCSKQSSTPCGSMLIFLKICCNMLFIALSLGAVHISPMWGQIRRFYPLIIVCLWFNFISKLLK